MSKKGTSAFIVQRATAVLLLPLGAWFLFSIVAHVGANYLTARAWLEKPWNGLLFAGFIVVSAWHMRIGMAEIIIDYIHSWIKDVLLVLNWLASIMIIVATCWAIFQITFAG